jgi:hypothetical protein
MKIPISGLVFEEGEWFTGDIGQKTTNKQRVSKLGWRSEID